MLTKRVYSRPQPIITDEYCAHGCGNLGRYQSTRGIILCELSANRCPAIRAKNSAGLKRSYANGTKQVTLTNRVWAKGLTKETDSRIAARSARMTGVTRPGHACSDKTKQVMRNHRIRKILEGSFDSSGRKGHRGHYHGMYFHSSWELAFYVFWTEVLNKQVLKNTTRVFNYAYKGSNYKYIPDFVVDGQYYEIKSYLFSDRDKAKYEQTRHQSTYLFGSDLQDALRYTRQKYGKQFWNVLYGELMGIGIPITFKP